MEDGKKLPISFTNFKSFRMTIWHRHSFGVDIRVLNFNLDRIRIGLIGHRQLLAVLDVQRLQCELEIRSGAFFNALNRRNVQRFVLPIDCCRDACKRRESIISAEPIRFLIYFLTELPGLFIWNSASLHRRSINFSSVTSSAASNSMVRGTLEQFRQFSFFSASKMYV